MTSYVKYSLLSGKDGEIMDVKALFKLTYGLFMAGAELDGKKSGCIINTAAQATSEPARVLLTMLKTNNTTSVIREKGSLAISILSINTPMDVIQNFGYQSSRDVDKFKNTEHITDPNGNPYLKNDAIAYLSLKVSQTIDLDSHFLFICDVSEAEVLSEELPMTYAEYRNRKSGGGQAVIKPTGESEIKAGEPAKKKTWTCSVCHYVYDPDAGDEKNGIAPGTPFEELPDSWVCPVCKQPKSVFFPD